MQLLHSNPYPVAEFASLSLLVEPPSSLEAVHPASASNAQDTQSTKGGGDPILQQKPMKRPVHRNHPRHEQPPAPSWLRP